MRTHYQLICRGKTFGIDAESDEEAAKEAERIVLETYKKHPTINTRVMLGTLTKRIEVPFKYSADPRK